MSDSYSATTKSHKSKFYVPKRPQNNNLKNEIELVKFTYKTQIEERMRSVNPKTPRNVFFRKNFGT